MNKRKKFLPLMMIALVSVFALAGCGSTSDTNTDTDTSSASAESSLDEETGDSGVDEQLLTIGMITNVDESSITLDLYEALDDVSDVADIDTASLSETGESKTITLQDDVVVNSRVNGLTQTADTTSLAVGDLVAVSDEDGQEIIILETDATTDTTTGSDNTTTGTGDTSASENTTTGTSDTSTGSENETGIADDSSLGTSSENTATVD